LEQFTHFDNNRFNYQFAYLAKENKETVGFLLGFPSSSLRKLETQTFFHIWQIYSFVSRIKFIFSTIPLAGLKEVYGDAWYIAHLAVKNEFRRRGIGSHLPKYAEGLAIQARLPKCALIVEEFNDAAIKTYDKNGYSIREDDN